MNKNAKKKTENGIFKRQKSVIMLPQKRTMGIDIGSKNIKLAVVKKDHILAAVSEPIPNGVVVDGVIEAPEILVKCLRNAKKHLHSSARHATLCLSGKDVIMREITLPQMKEEQVLSNIKNELSNIYLLASGDYTIDYRILSTTNNELTGEKSMRVLVVSAPKSLLSDYIKVCKRAGLRLKRIDVLPNAHTKLIRNIINNQTALEEAQTQLSENNEEKKEKQGKKDVKKISKKTKFKQRKHTKKLQREAAKQEKFIKEQKLQKEKHEQAISKAKAEAKQKAEKEERLKKAREEKKKAEAEAARAAKEAFEKHQKTREEKKPKDPNVHEISWYFGRKLNDLDQNLYDPEPAIVPKRIDDHYMPNPIRVSESRPAHAYLSDEEASNILDNLMNNSFKAKEEAEEPKKKNILENVCLIDIGFTMSNVTFIRNGSYSMHKNIRYGGEYINEAISEKMSLDMNSAESFKLSLNNDKEGALHEYYDSIISELDNTMYYYKTNNNQNGVDCIVIAGGSSRLGGIKDYFADQLGVPVYMLSEISDFKIGSKLIKRCKGVDIHFEDYLGAVSITLKEEWV